MSPKNDVEMGLSYTVINTNKSFQKVQYGDYTLRNKCQYSELFWSAFSHSRTEYGGIRSISLYSVRMQENAD